MWRDCTFSFLCRVTAHSLNAVNAISLDGTQTQHLGVVKNSIDLISDPVQGHHLTLCEPQTDRFKRMSNSLYAHIIWESSNGRTTAKRNCY